MVALSEVTTLCTVDPQILFFWKIVLSIAALLLSHVHCNIILSTCIRQFLWDLTEIALSTDRPQDKWHDSCTKPIHKHYFSLRLLWPLSCSHGFSAETLYWAHLRAALITCSLPFFHLKVFVLPAFPKGMWTAYRTLGWKLFPLGWWKTASLSTGSHGSWWAV